jgi:hypothetical protein
MKKIQITGIAILVMLAFSSVIVSSASAAEWEVEGKGVVQVVNVNSHGAIILVHEGGTFGDVEVECTGLLDGTVGPNGTGLIRLVLSLSGSSTENDLIKCTNIKAPCENTPTVHVENLPWLTKLLTVGTTIFTDFEEDESPFNKGIPALDVLCRVLLQEVFLLCLGLVRATFIGNLANGALLRWEKGNTLFAQCSDGGKEWIITGKITTELLGANIR